MGGEGSIFPPLLWTKSSDSQTQTSRVYLSNPPPPPRRPSVTSVTHNSCYLPLRITKQQDSTASQAKIFQCDWPFQFSSLHLINSIARLINSALFSVENKFVYNFQPFIKSQSFEAQETADIIWHHPFMLPMRMLVQTHIFNGF